MEMTGPQTAGYIGRLTYKTDRILKSARCRFMGTGLAPAEYFNEIALVSEVRLRAVAYKLQSLVKSTVTSGSALRRIGVLATASAMLLVLIIAPVLMAFDRSALAGASETGAEISSREAPNHVLFRENRKTEAVHNDVVMNDPPVSATNPGLRGSGTDHGEYTYYSETDDTFSEYMSLIRGYPATGGSYNDPEFTESPDAAWGELLFEEATVPAAGGMAIFLAAEEITRGDLYPSERSPAPSVAENEPSAGDSFVPERVVGGLPAIDESVSDNIQDTSGKLEDISDGSPALSPTASTGCYVWPASGTLSSTYGRRSTSVGSVNHKGIDISGPSNTPIFAADGGEVIFSGWNKSYGYMVQIRHDNGHETLYAHCNSMLVSEGDLVAQGQEIARMGKTGTATGVHVHFELLINGKNVDPLPYLQ